MGKEEMGSRPTPPPPCLHAHCCKLKPTCTQLILMYIQFQQFDWDPVTCTAYRHVQGVEICTHLRHILTHIHTTRKMCVGKHSGYYTLLYILKGFIASTYSMSKLMSKMAHKTGLLLAVCLLGNNHHILKKIIFHLYIKGLLLLKPVWPENFGQASSSINQSTAFIDHFLLRLSAVKASWPTAGHWAISSCEQCLE